DSADPPAAPGAAPDAAPSGPCPVRMVQVGRACIDMYEAHLVAHDVDGGVRVLPHNERPPSDVAFEAESSADEFPQAYISRVEAKAACTRVGKRLCSMAEWQRACQGRRAQNYPYGPRYRSGMCNSGKPH